MDYYSQPNKRSPDAPVAPGESRRSTGDPGLDLIARAQQVGDRRFSSATNALM
jgi:hypothetical protein